MPMSHSDLVSYLVRTGALQTPRLIDAFFAIDRKNFIRPEYVDEAYDDYPLPIGKGQTISQPSTVAFMLELLQPEQGDRVLDIGSGSGWTTALLAHSIGERGEVLGLELDPELAAWGKENLRRYVFPHARIEQAVSLTVGAGPQLGRPCEKYDKILVSAAADSFPSELLSQLKEGGRMVLPVGHTLYKVEKRGEDDMNTESFPGFAFVPLRRKG